jgi:hypothetical protein
MNNPTPHIVEAIVDCQSLFENAISSRLASPFLKRARDSCG